PCAGSTLAYAIKIRVVVLAREIDSRFPIAQGEIFTPKKCGRVGIGIWRQPVRDCGQRARRNLFVERAVRVERHRTESSVRRFVRLQILYGRISRERSEHRLQTGTRADSPGTEDNV